MIYIYIFVIVHLYFLQFCPKHSLLYVLYIYKHAFLHPWEEVLEKCMATGSAKAVRHNWCLACLLACVVPIWLAQTYYCSFDSDVKELNLHLFTITWKNSDVINYHASVFMKTAQKVNYSSVA